MWSGLVLIPERARGFGADETGGRAHDRPMVNAQASEQLSRHKSVLS